MPDNNYEPPRAPLRDPGTRVKRSNLLAIIVGALVDFTSTQVAGVFVILLFAVAAGGSAQRMQDLQNQLNDSTVYLVIASAVGLLCSVLGGYVCARFANQNEYANGLACGVVGVIAGELMFTADTSIAMHFLGLLTIPACLLGAHLKMRRQKPE
ncbi:MAG TPA: hypothetical protein VGN52_19980 [Burkholderiales bacterium]|jgi:tetrahydromethanopterin S-methyltransferase subunit C